MIGFTKDEKITNIRRIIRNILLAIIMCAIVGGILISSIPSLRPPPFGEKTINMVAIVLELNFTEVESINFTDAAMKLKMISFTIENCSENGYHYLIKRWSITIYIDADETNGIRKAVMDVSYSAAFPESDLSIQKQYLKDQVDEVASACNITLDWSKATWTFSYQD